MPELGAYGLQNRHTPNIDRLAKGGVYIANHGELF